MWSGMRVSHIKINSVYWFMLHVLYKYHCRDSRLEKAGFILLFAVVTWLQELELEQCRDCYCREFYASILDGNQHSMYLVRISFFDHLSLVLVDK